MSNNSANSQRPPRGDPARKSTGPDPDRRASSSAGTVQQASRPVASPPPGQYANYSAGYHTVPPPLHSHHHHHPGQQTGSAYPTFASPLSVEGYGYVGPPFHPARHNVDAHSYARPPSRTQSQSSGSGGAASPHDVVAGSHYTPHFSTSFSAVSSNPSVGHSGRTRWAWVPIEVPQAHLPDDAHLQYAPYPAAFYPSPAASATSTGSSAHQSYQQSYGSEGSVQASAAYGVQASPNYAASFPYHLHPGSYGPPPGHNTLAHVASAGGQWSGSSPGGLQPTGVTRDSVLGSRRQPTQSGRPGNNARRTSSNSSGQQSSPHPGSSALPHRPQGVSLDPTGAQSDSADTTASQKQQHDAVSKEARQDDADISISESVCEAELHAEADAPSDVTNAARVPGSGLRPHYHPQQGPRSDFVLWCGNVPQDATVEELWEVFSRLTPEVYREWLASPEAQEQVDEGSDAEIEGHGVLSIFIISRSNCAFVNYASPAHLDRAVKYFHGKQVRPHDPRCPKLVCRVRKKDDEAQAGVAGQRGRGIHVAWLKQQRELERAQKQSGTVQASGGVAALDDASQHSSEPLSPPRKDSTQAAAGFTSAGSYSSSGSASYTSTNSSLFQHPAFRHRFFILKSLRSDDLDRSIETGYWATQPHNENVLDQAYRNSETVFLIFGVNQTGQFHGYAKMAGPIHTPTIEGKGKDEQRRRASLSSVVSTASSSIPPATIHESADESADDLGPTPASGPGESGSGPSHPVLDKRDIDAARGLFSTLSVDGVGEAPPVLAMTSPQPLSPSTEEGTHENALSPQRNDTITPRTAGSIAQSSTWPYTSTRSSASETDAGDRPKLASTLSADGPTSMTSEPDEYGVRRKDMETESAQTKSSQSDQPSLAPSDSASWSSADPRMAEQIALRAVIHNLRLDEMESRGKAELLENQLRSASDDTDATATARGSEIGGQEGDERTPPRQSSSDSWGKPFRVEWIRTDPLPFQRVKKLRNPWRDNRQVKVSRDGTELEPGVGRQLLEEWNRLHSVAPIDSTKTSKHTVPQKAQAAQTASDEDE